MMIIVLLFHFTERSEECMFYNDVSLLDFVFFVSVINFGAHARIHNHY